MEYNYQSYFKQIVDENFLPYSYQKVVSEKILSGKNLILSVPTGAGKTWAAILPFLIAQIEKRLDFPQKLIYSLPMRTLTNSIFNEVSEKLNRTTLFEGSTQIQTGEYNNDPTFEGDLVFATIDQSLSGFLSFPLGLSKVQANINAGAWIGSYLVFDEFHLLDEKRAMATTLGALRMLNGLCQFCIMTATMSEKLMRSLQDVLPNTEIVTLTDFPNDKDKIASLKPTKDKKKVTVCEVALKADVILDKHRERTIVICNQVETAQKLYMDIEGRIAGTKVLCLHSRFFDKDRKEKESQLKKLFGRGSQENAILITTQVVEAGMDLSCQTLHTQVSPVNSFLQRAGRCARFDGETGEIYVYDIEEKSKESEGQEGFRKEEKENKRQYLPYDADLCKDTLNALKSVNTLDGDIPEKLVEKVLNTKEQEIFEEMRTRQFNNDDIKKSWSDCEKNNYRDTIRDIQNIEITLITEELEYEVVENPYGRQSIGMFYGSFLGWLKKKKKLLPPEEVWNDEDIWLIKELTESTIIDFIDMGQKAEYTLRAADTSRPPLQVFANANQFGYSPDFGMHIFTDKIDGTVSPQVETKAEKGILHSLRKDTFYQHNKALLGCFEEKFKSKLRFACSRLSDFLNLPHLEIEEWDKLIYLMIILHDYGKLNANWQTPMRKYQARKETMTEPLYPEILAHTDYDYSDHDKALGKAAGINRRPPHSGIGAFEAIKIIEEQFGDSTLADAVAFSIARHHDPFNQGRNEFNIPFENYKEMKRLLEEYGFKTEMERKGGKDKLDAFGSWQARIPYFFLVRILRLCDQKATEDWQKYFTMHTISKS